MPKKIIFFPKLVQLSNTVASVLNTSPNSTISHHSESFWGKSSKNYFYVDMYNTLISVSWLKFIQPRSLTNVLMVFYFEWSSV